MDFKDAIEKTDRIKSEYFKLIINEKDYEPSDGVIAVPPSKDNPKYNYSKMFQYCRDKNIKPRDLTKEERVMFVIK